MSETKLQTFAVVGSYPPRKCGIATFSKDLYDSVVRDASLRGLVLAMDDVEEGYDYPSEVSFEIKANELKDFELATDFLNINQIDVVLLQHEFGLFGPRAGENVVSLVRDTRMPVITTLHTILEEPSHEQALVMKELVRHSDRIVVMSQRGREIMERTYAMPRGKIAVIPHGIPDLPFIDPSFYKDRFSLTGAKVLMTFGLLSPGKGIETVIEALPEIVRKRPDVLYVIVGTVHPHVEKAEGLAYIHSLQRLAKRLGVSKNVVFHTRYVSLEELCAYLGAADIYVTPYPNRHQIVSGTLSYAMGAGKALVSTPYLYAEEVLAENRGKLFEIHNSAKLAEVVLGLLENPTEMDSMRKAAYTYSRHMIWSEVGAEYRRLATEVMNERRKSPRSTTTPTASIRPLANLPHANIRHLQAMTDSTGILQHSTYSIPNRAHGYCTDDNARALLAGMIYWEFTEDEDVLPLARNYLAFLLHAWDPVPRRFRNFMSYDRQWISPPDYSEDAFGRTLWALGKTVEAAPGDALRLPAVRLFSEALAGAEETRSPRAWAHCILGIQSYLRHYSGDSFARRQRQTLTHRLRDLFAATATKDWYWCESIVTYDNAILPHALIVGGQALNEPDLVQQGLNALEWLLRIQTDDQDRLTLIGNEGWYRRGEAPAAFDQQPLDAAALVMACCEAYRATSEEVWYQRAWTCLEWFLGNNCKQAPLFDPTTGGCRDGLSVNGANDNQGAESTVTWLLALSTIHKIYREKNVYTGNGTALPARQILAPAVA